MLNRKSIIEQVGFRGLSLALNLSVALLVPRILLPEVNGVYALLTANVAIAVLVIGFSLESAIVYYISNRHFTFSGMIKALRMVFVVQLVAVLAVLGINGLAHNAVAFFPAEHNAISAMWAALFLLALLGNNLLVSVLNGLGKFRQVNLLNACQGIVQLLMLAVVMVTDRFAEHKLYIIYLLVLTNFVSPLLALFFVKYKPAPEEALPQGIAEKPKMIIRALMQYAVIAFVANLVQQLAYRIDFWILDYFNGKTALGIYSVGTRLSQLLWVFPAALATIILPAVANEGKAAVYKKVKQLSVVGVLLGIGAALGLVLLIKYLGVWILGEAYAGLWIPLALMLPGYAAFIVVILSASYFSGIRKVHLNLLQSAFCLVLIAATDLVLIPQMGMNGAAIANTVAYLGTALLSVILLRKYAPDKIEQ